jgi:hypothetical protein
MLEGRPCVRRACAPGLSHRHAEEVWVSAGHRGQGTTGPEPVSVSHRVFLTSPPWAAGGEEEGKGAQGGVRYSPSTKRGQRAGQPGAEVPQ